MITTSIPDATERLLRQFNVESAHNAQTLTPLQGGQPYTPANLAEIESAVAAWRPFSLSAPAAQFAHATGVTVTITTAADVTSVDVLVRGQSVSVPIVGGVGTLQINASAPTLPPHIVIQAQNQAVFGYATLTLEAV